jgi:hypothetical protein
VRTGKYRFNKAADHLILLGGGGVSSLACFFFTLKNKKPSCIRRVINLRAIDTRHPEKKIDPAYHNGADPTTFSLLHKKGASDINKERKKERERERAGMFMELF